MTETRNQLTIFIIYATNKNEKNIKGLAPWMPPLNPYPKNAIKYSVLEAKLRTVSQNVFSDIWFTETLDYFYTHKRLEIGQKSNTRPFLYVFFQVIISMQ